MPGQIVVDPDNPRWFRYHEGGPFFMAGPGDPEDFLYRGRLRPDGTRDGDQLKLIRKLARTGANSIYLQAVRSHGGDGNPTHNPFINHDPAEGLNPAVLDQWEGWFSEMDRHGIVIFFFFYDDSASIWHTGHEVGPEERAFVHELVDRFKHHKHLIWVVAEEYEERYSWRRVSQIAAEIRAVDTHNHPIATHKWHGLQFSEFADDPHLNQFAMQYNVPTPAALHEGVLTAWRQTGGTVNLNLAEALEWGSGSLARRKAWSVAMAGAYVMAFQMDIATTPVSDLEDCGRLVDFMESTDFHLMEPRDDLATGDTLYVLARRGRSYIAYAPEGRDRVGLKGLRPGTYRLRWLDIPSGRAVVQEGLSLAAGDQYWARPRGIGREAALYVQRQDAGGELLVTARIEPQPRIPGAAEGQLRLASLRPAETLRPLLSQREPTGGPVAVAADPASLTRETTLLPGETVFADLFDRQDSQALGNRWVEVESDSKVAVSDGTLLFDPKDDDLRPMTFHTFSAQSSGYVRWSFEMNFRRTGNERSYGIWMQLGNRKQMNETEPKETGVAVNLKWGGPDRGLLSHEGFGYVVDGEVTHVATVSGRQLVTVEVDLDRQVYSLEVGGERVEGVPFENRVEVDTVRFFADAVNGMNFESLRIDNVMVSRATAVAAVSGEGSDPQEATRLEPAEPALPING